MKKLSFASVIALAFTMLISSCSKEGPAGPAGPAGANGTNGTNGNANVTQFNYPAFTNTGVTNTFTIAVSKADMDKSLAFVYVQNGGNWYPIPGNVQGTHEYRNYFFFPVTTATTMDLKRVSGAGNQDFTAMRIIIIPASSMVSGRNTLNYDNYLEVAEYYNLPINQ